MDRILTGVYKKIQLHGPTWVVDRVTSELLGYSFNGFYISVQSQILYSPSSSILLPNRADLKKGDYKALFQLTPFSPTKSGFRSIIFLPKFPKGSF